MTEIITKTIWEKTIDKGLTLAILLIAVYVLYQRDKELNAKIDENKTKIELYLKEDRAQMIKVIENNTVAINNWTAASLKNERGF